MKWLNRYSILLGFLVLFYAINNYCWIRQDSANTGFDVPTHTKIAITIRQGLIDISHSSVGPVAKCKSIYALCTQGILLYPRLVHCVAAVASLACKDAIFGLRFSNIIYFVILVVSVYFLGKRVHSRAAGLISAYVVALYPALYGSSRKFGLDFPLAAAVCLIFYFLLASDAFRDRKSSIFFGISLGLGALIKGQVVFYILGPLLYTVFLGIKDRQRVKNTLHVAISLLVAACIAMVWWYRIATLEGLRGIDRHLVYSKDVPASEITNLVFSNGQHYFADTYADVSPLFSILFLAGLVFFLRRLNKKTLFVALWLGASYLVLFFIPTMVDRFIIPTFGAIALISAIGWLESPLKKNVKMSLILLAVILGTAQFFVVSYYKRIPAFASVVWGHPPQRNNYQSLMEEFNRGMQESFGGEGKTIGLVESQRFCGDGSIALEYRLKLLNGKNKVFLSGDGYFVCNVVYDFLANVDDYDFVITTSDSALKPDFQGLLECGSDTYKEFAQKVIQRFAGYQVIRKGLLMPDNVYIFLLKKPAAGPGT